MMELRKRIKAFVQLGEIIRNQSSQKLNQLAVESVRYNGWFTEEMVKHMLGAIGESLKEENLNQWLQPYKTDLEKKKEEKTIGVVMAGNIPAVGFHDFISVLVTGNKLKAKLSGDDNKILPAMAEILIDLESSFSGKIEFTEERLKDFDAIIATGSTNTSRYFKYYFGKYPNIIRKNRNGIAVLNGKETEEDMNGLADDIFLYYGLGCRNVSKIFVPENYDILPLLEVLASRKKIAENHKYFNNYEYNKAIYLVNSTKHFDSGNILVTEDERLASPISVLYFSIYKSVDGMKDFLAIQKDNIQCVVSNIEDLDDAIPFGTSQQPQLWDYADGIDTVRFILSID